MSTTPSTDPRAWVDVASQGAATNPHEVRQNWTPEALRVLDRWNRADYPLWHDQMRMSDKLSESRPDQVLVRGDGCWVEDVAGRRLLDARAGVANVVLGYGRRDVVEAMHRQADELPFGCVIRYSRPALTSLRYAAELVAAAPPSLTRVRLTHMGSASVENALQMSRLYHRNIGRPERTWIVSLAESYHGSTHLTLAASGESFIDQIVVEPPPRLAHAPLPELAGCPGCTGDATRTGSCVAGLVALLDRLDPDRVAAVIVEPVMDRRVFPLTSHFLAEVRRLADEQGFLLIFDEVITGFGRIGRLFAADRFGVEPDILCLAKGITSGYAMLGAVLVNDRVFDAFDRPGGQHFPNGSSTDGHPVSCAAASATLAALLGGGILDNVKRQGERVRADLGRRLADDPLVVDVRGIGLLTGVEFGDAPRHTGRQLARLAQRACDRHGVLVQHGHNLIVLYPPLVISDDETDFAAERVARAVAEVTTVAAG